MQWILVTVCIVIACLYAVWRVRNVITNRKDPCAGCEGCALKDTKRRNKTCDLKKQQ